MKLIDRYKDETYNIKMSKMCIIIMCLLAFNLCFSIYTLVKHNHRGQYYEQRINVLEDKVEVDEQIIHLLEQKLDSLGGKQ